MGSHIWQFLAGIALFLYAINLIETIAKSGGGSFQKRVQKFTSNNFKSVLTGIGLVNIIQSSHAVSLILLALVGADLVSLVHGVAVIVGMNIGSTFMQAFVGLFGLGFDLDVYVLPIIAIGGLGTLFNKKYKNFFLIVLSLGLVFFGLEMMKDGVVALKEAIDITKFSHLGRGWYILIGFVATNIIQSSSAMTIIAMTALYEDVIPFPLAAALVMGSFLGSTTTAFVISLNGSAIKKQVATSHVLINVVTILLYSLFFTPITNLIQNIRGFGSGAPWFGSFLKSSVNGLIVFFVSFRLIGGLIHLPFLKQITRILQWLIPDDKNERLGIENIDPKLDVFTSYTIIQLDVKEFVEESTAFIKLRTNNPEKYDEDKYFRQKNHYEKIFRFLIIFPFHKLGFEKGEEMYAINALQEAMQGMDTIVSTYDLLKNVALSKDPKTKNYRKSIIEFCNEIYDLIEKKSFKQAEKKLLALKDRDDEEMARLILEGKQVSTDLAELFQIHDKIYGTVSCVLDSKNNLEKLV